MVVSISSDSFSFSFSRHWHGCGAGGQAVEDVAHMRLVIMRNAGLVGEWSVQSRLSESGTRRRVPCAQLPESSLYAVWAEVGDKERIRDDSTSNSQQREQDNG